MTLKRHYYDIKPHTYAKEIKSHNYDIMNDQNEILRHNYDIEKP